MSDFHPTELSVDLLATLDIAVYVWELEDPADPTSLRLVYANPATAAMTGTPVEVLLGRTVVENFPRSDGDERARALAAVALGGPARDLGDTAYVTEGGDRTYAIRYVPLPDRRVAVVCNEVTRQRNAEAKALQIMDSASDPIFAFDHELRYTFVNAEAERIARHPRVELIGRSLTDIYPAIASTKLYEALARANAERRQITFEEHFDELGYWMVFRVDPSEDGVVLYAHDITARKNLEEQIVHAEKMTAVSTLAGGIAHDFNNALTAIRTAAQLGLAAGGEDEMRADLEQIDLVAERVSSLTTQMVAISRGGAWHAESAGIDDVLASMQQLLTHLVGDSVSVSMELAADGCVVALGASEIQQVLFNLCLNARDAMPSGGSVHIRTSTKVLDETEAFGLENADPGTYVALEVSDTGTGMNREVTRRALEPFFTTKSAGSGLGLASVYGLLTQVGGHIALASRPAAGTTVSVLIPVTDVAAPTERDVDAESARVAAPRTVLVAEDDDQIRPLVARALERWGYRVVCASRGDDALAAAERFDGPIDLLLSDVVMPGLDGVELATRLREARPAVGVLFMSGYASDLLVHKGIGRSDAGFVAKPFHLDALRTAVEDALAPMARGPAPELR